MRTNLVRCTLLLGLASLFMFGARPIYSQQNDPIENGVPVNIFRQPKPTRRSSPKARPVDKAPLLKLEWRLYKVLADGSDQEAGQDTFERGDRLRLLVRTNQAGYLYVVYQKSPGSPGEVIFPDFKLNYGSSSVYRGAEFVLPSNCPVKTSRRDCAIFLTSSAEPEIFHLLFSRDPFTDLPNSASDANQTISPETLEKLMNDSGQTLKPQRGSTPFSQILVNINTSDNEDIIAKIVVDKRP
ncbi:MAG TPA: hypothetical protein VFH46_10505 [Pyrinomonadaceae bacterium]|nr:hypothetical protein [Pyrinomonadaceae bacterium]